MKTYVVYYRVLTQKNVLGLDAQRQMVKNFLATNSGKKISEHVEVEFVRDMKRRPILEKAIWIVKQDIKKRCLLVPKLDRLARDVSFLASLKKSKINFECTDMPQANKMTINILLAIAQKNREFLSGRVKAGMKKAKKRGRKFGTDNRKTRKGLFNYHKNTLAEPVPNRPLNKRGVAYSLSMKPIIVSLIRDGMDKTQIAQFLTDCKVETVRGKTKWTCDHLNIVLKNLVHDNQSIA